ncbi:MAG TPA: RNA methyltransferase [Bacteroidales bacterium]|nr:RNA methyltransferase [Bacteroidales bacterium]
MLTKNTIKYIKSLTAKKFREIHGRFIAEGPKIISDIAGSALTIEKLFATQQWLDENLRMTENIEEVTCVTPKELAAISQLTTPNNVVAVVKIPKTTFSQDIAAHSLVITLDDIRDPGNLGTIIRIADWFGYQHILCSETSVDAYNPKCVQATMGSIARVHIYYENLHHILSQGAATTNIFGTFLSGAPVFNEPLQNKGFLIIGNEANGITPEIEKLVKKRLFIPSGSETGSHAESLNASVATAIICAEFFRRSYKPTK